jgi:hypothetical protein
LPDAIAPHRIICAVAEQSAIVCLLYRHVDGRNFSEEEVQTSERGGHARDEKYRYRHAD